MSFRVKDEKSFFVLVENAKSLAVLEMTRRASPMRLVL
jgi:hypothetical protein